MGLSPRQYFYFGVRVQRLNLSDDLIGFWFGDVVAVVKGEPVSYTHLTLPTSDLV